MEQKLVRVEDGIMAEVNQYLRNGWKAIDMKVCSLEVGFGRTYCYVLIEKIEENKK